MLKVVKKCIYCFSFIFMYLISNAFAFDIPAGATVVIDPQGLEQSVTSYEQMLKQYDQFEDYKRQVGNGELTPSTVNKLSKLYEKCGGKKVGLPNLFPSPLK